MNEEKSSNRKTEEQLKKKKSEVAQLLEKLGNLRTQVCTLYNTFVVLYICFINEMKVQTLFANLFYNLEHTWANANVMDRVFVK